MFGNILGGITNFFAYKSEVTHQLSNYFVGSFTRVINFLICACQTQYCGHRKSSGEKAMLPII